MRPVNQEFKHDPENGVHGDCFRAVLASLLSLPISEVPHFIQDGVGTEWAGNDHLAHLLDRIDAPEAGGTAGRRAMVLPGAPTARHLG